jgi:hypothetical protein
MKCVYWRQKGLEAVNKTHLIIWVPDVLCV